MRTVVLVGGGHAHVQVLRRFAMDPPENARLLVVLDRPGAVYSGMVPGFVAGDYTADQLTIDVLPLARRAGAGVIFSPAVDLDPVRHEVALEDRPALRFDLASLDVGSTVRGLDLPGVRAHALSTRPIGRFIRELEARLPELAALAGPPRIAIVGSGAAGVEIAFTLEARLRAGGLAPEIELITPEPALLLGANASARRAIAREAATRGIAARFEARAVRVDAAGVFTQPAARTPAPEALDSAKETLHRADLVIWATGAAPGAFPRHQGTSRLATDDEGFLSVRDTLQAVGHEDVFAVGDCARMVEHPWIPRAGVYAVRQGPILEANLRARLAGSALRRYRPQRDFLSLLNLGDRRALGSKWGLALRGRSAYRLKDGIDRRFMARFQVLDAAGAPFPAMARLGAMGGEDEEPMPCGGCAAKLGALPLAAALAELPAAPPDESVVLGVDARDDVGATRDEAGRITLHNVDAIRAFCDDPWLVGRVAAVNALSDLHAKGGRPRHAQAILALPELPPATSQEILKQALAGVRTVLDAEGVALLGGHTTIGDALSIGLSVTGEGPDEDTLLRQAGARPGDLLLLTQPIGTGVVLAADMQGLVPSEWLEATYAVMTRANDVAGRLAREEEVHAATDVTGFGLAGHLLTLLEPSGLVARLERDAIPLLPGALELWGRGLRSTAHPQNEAAFEGRVEGARREDRTWLFDPQTAGGLLLAVPPDRAAAICARFASDGEPPVHRLGSLASPAADAPGQAGTIRIVDGSAHA